MSRRRPASAIFQPVSSSACAVARPMPLPAPVMTAIFTSFAMSILRLAGHRPAALLVGAVPEQELVLRRAPERAEHRRPQIRARCGSFVGGADDPRDRGA